MLLLHDARAFPVEAPVSLLDDKKKKKKKQAKTLLPPENTLDIIPERELNAAKEMT